jgi:hypothetical protein
LIWRHRPSYWVLVEHHTFSNYTGTVQAMEVDSVAIAIANVRFPFAITVTIVVLV